MNTYKEVCQAIYDIVNGLTLTGLTATGTWASGFNYEPKELLNFPAFAVTPFEDRESVLDSTLNEDRISIAVRIYNRYEDSASSEDQMRQLVDKYRDGIRKALSLTNKVDFQAETKGRWLFEAERGLRIYEHIITAVKAESIL